MPIARFHLRRQAPKRLSTAAASTYIALMPSVISVKNLSKSYASGLAALTNINLDINRGEIFALLGPNGAGKTTLISIICGIVNKSQGSINVDGRDTVKDFRYTRSIIGLVPQELHLPIFETVWDNVTFSRALFGGSKNPAHIEKILRQLSLWEKKDAKIMTLSGGMKRRVLIAKALAHEPKILFLDEPTAGVDVELRKDMWAIVRSLREQGVTIILTTHYIEEAEEMADRVGVINKGEMILIEEKSALMKKMGQKKLVLELVKPLKTIPKSLQKHKLALSQEGRILTYEYDARATKAGVTPILSDLAAAKIVFGDLHTEQSSLEDIFIGLVKQ
jgi:ABC-2 type transport system ATP-binding protein